MTGMFARQAHAFATHRIDGPELEAAWRAFREQEAQQETIAALLAGLRERRAAA